jgi:hypothetical protein
LAVDAQKSRSTSEADLLKMSKQSVHIVGAGVQWPPYRGTYVDNPGGLRAASQLLLAIRVCSGSFHVKQARRSWPRLTAKELPRLRGLAELRLAELRGLAELQRRETWP